MKKAIRAEPDIYGKLQFRSVMGIRRLKFLLLEYRFFSDGEDSRALFINLPWLFFPLSFMFYIVETRALDLLKLPCCFVKLGTKIVGLWAIREQNESLLVASLGVAKDYRQLGIGTCILSYIETIAKHRNKKWLEVDVLTKNIPAQRLYTKYGFTLNQTGKTLFRMSGKKPLYIIDEFDI